MKRAIFELDDGSIILAVYAIGGTGVTCHLRKHKAKRWRADKERQHRLWTILEGQARKANSNKNTVHHWINHKFWVK